MRTKKKHNSKIVAFDIEATDLGAAWGRILCACFKQVGSNKIKTIRIDDSPTFKNDPTDDTWLCEQILKEFDNIDILLTWYGARFDVPFVNSRCIANGLAVLPPVAHIDGWRTAKYRLKLMSNRLQSVTEFLGLDDKTPLSSGMWVKARAGNRKALNYVVEHCKQDVRVLDMVYERIKPLVQNHPNVNLTKPPHNGTHCPVCGSENLHERGWTVAKVRRSKRYQCQDCGAWSRGKPQAVLVPLG